MTKTFTLILACAITLTVKAQTIPTTQTFGKIDKADLELKSCDFEMDANAMVLFNKGEISYDSNFDLSMERHVRIKIFNDKGKNQANVRLEYFSGGHVEYINGVQAQTINLVDGKPEITKIDKKLIYTELVDKSRSALVFSLPNVKAGSVIEYKYVLNTNSIANFPDWYFQDKIPSRYSELTTIIPEQLYFSLKTNVTQPFIKNSEESDARTANGVTYKMQKTTKAIANIRSLPDEPYMSSFVDNLQSLTYQLVSMQPVGGVIKKFTDSWPKVGGVLADDSDFGMQLKRKLEDEEAIIAKAAGYKTNEEKIAYIFSIVKDAMKWNGSNSWYTNEGTVKAWEKKTGNAAEINLILYHLLKKAGVPVYPMVVSSRNHGKVSSYYPFLYQFNKAVVYAELGDKTFVLDATDKFNIYKETPASLLNSQGLYIDKDKGIFDLVLLKKEEPVRQVTLINAEIKPTGKMQGTAQINSFSYNRISSLSRFKTDGEKKYIEFLTDNSNNLKVTSLKFDNAEVDTLPLKQNIDFTQELTGSDDNYIYFNANLFTSLRTNPFLSEGRATDIEFGYHNNYLISGTFTIPANYKVDALPKPVNMAMPDNSIVFKRAVSNEGVNIVIRYSIDFKNAVYSRANYAEFYDFNKKMYEFLNGQIVLKKS
ncbi:DUF3857 domain-containing protein [Mucilaginibacter gilvus]|uniref:DUF3857 domain-containing protein n=1 Tax=Mucilaginibacter gilvus TaxID=2305909 RepID=A0A3S3V541_9SPHI|nr:DUF3857 domain-containing protein [Mucilaginibacter gilvus]RWY55887.1 DUF3857 domain-containing protein [Mucilaginibacter gilvus]